MYSRIYHILTVASCQIMIETFELILSGMQSQCHEKKTCLINCLAWRKLKHFTA